MIKIRSTIRQTFPIFIHHHHLRFIVIFVENRLKKECHVGDVFVTNVDALTVCAILRVLTRLNLTIRTLIVILKMIFMSKIRITMVIHFKIQQILNIVGDRLKIFMSLIHVTILMVLTNPTNFRFY